MNIHTKSTTPYRRLILLIITLITTGLVGQAQALPFTYLTRLTGGYTDDVVMLDTNTNTVTATIPTGQYSGAVTVNHAGTRAYVVNSGDNTVSVINTVTKAVIATLPVGEDYLREPRVLTLNPNDTRGYVPNPGNSTVSVINTVNNGIVTTIPVAGGKVGALALNPAGTRAYVVVSDMSGPEVLSKVAVINTVTNRVVATIAINGAAEGIVLHPNGTRAYVPYNGDTYYDNYVAVINTASNSVIANIHINVLGPVSGFIKINPAGTRLYGVIGYSDVTPTHIYVVNTINNSFVTAKNFGFGNMGDFILNAAGTRAYLTLDDWNSICGSQLIVFNTASNTGFSLSANADLASMALHPLDTRLYIAHFNYDYCPSTDRGLVLFNTANNTFGDTVSLGFAPGSITMGPPTNLRFSNAVYGVNEGAGRAVITVRRIGGAVGATSVQYNTANGSAVTPGDYTAKSGTLTWANGDTAPKTFTVPIVNDTAREPNETVRLILSAPTGGATLGSPAQATLTIINND